MAKALKQGARLDAAAHGHGHESHSGFREVFTRMFGPPLEQSREASYIVVSWVESPLGPLLMGASDDGICLLEFAARRGLKSEVATLSRHFKCALVPGEHAYLGQLQDELKRYFAGTLTEFTVPLVYCGSPFQRKVWKQLLQVPYGETCSYEDIARAVGSPAACRAVGTANGRN